MAAWISYDELRKKHTKELLQFISEQGAMAGDPAGAEQERNRELVKTMLEDRSTTVTAWQNGIMIVLTLVMSLLTYLIWRLSVGLASRG